MLHTYRETFTIKASPKGWQWQETGAVGWSELYHSAFEAQMAIDREFPIEAISLCPTD